MSVRAHSPVSVRVSADFIPKYARCTVQPPSHSLTTLCRTVQRLQTRGIKVAEPHSPSLNFGASGIPPPTTLVTR